MEEDDDDEDDIENDEEDGDEDGNVEFKGTFNLLKIWARTTRSTRRTTMMAMKTRRRKTMTMMRRKSRPRARSKKSEGFKNNVNS